jgi:MFS family permease
MKEKLIWSIFWALVGVFVIEMGMMFSGVLQNGYAIFGGLIALLGLGVTLLVLAARAKLKKMLKAFLLLTGASATGIFVFVLLHNLVYALFIYFLGGGFWRAGDEPVFFIMALFVCPLAFLVGAIGSIVLEFWPAKKARPKARAKTKRRAKRKRA